MGRRIERNLHIRGPAGVTIWTMLAVLLFALPSTSATGFPTVLVFTPPYSGFLVGHNTSLSYGPSGCAQASTPVAPYFNETSGIGGLFARANISSNCSAWAAGSTLGPNSSSAQVGISLSVNKSLNVSAVLGSNVTSGLVTAVENWTIAYRITESFYHQRGTPGPRCQQPYRSTWFYR